MIDFLEKLLAKSVPACLVFLFLFNILNANEKATFAGGCFWCMQPIYDDVAGVVNTTVGYTGGDKKNPTYEEVSNGDTGHVEAIEIEYDPEKISYEQLLRLYWRNIDPTNGKGQFCDIGSSYIPVIYYHNESQRKAADMSKQQLIDSGRFETIEVKILPAKPFYPAEEYHQKYYLKNPVKYKVYRYLCGRDARLAEVWGKDRD